MGKKLKVLILSMTIVCMAASVAIAGTAQVNHGAANTVITAALEAMSAARNAEIVAAQGNVTAASNHAITFTTTQNVTSTNFLSVVLTGAAFTGNTYRVCKAGHNLAYAIATPGAGSTSYNFQLNYATGAPNDLLAGDVLFITSNGACNLTVGSNGANNMIVQLPITASATNPSATLSIVSAGNMPVDSASTRQLANISAEFAVANTAAANTHTIDYLGAPGTGINFTAAVTGANNEVAASANAVAFVRTVKDYGAINGNQAGAGLSVLGFVQLVDSMNWAGVNKVYINTYAAYNCIDNAANNVVGTSTLTSATINLAIPTAAYNGINLYGEVSNAASRAQVPVNVCIEGRKNVATPLTQRTITIAGAVNATGRPGATSSLSTFDIWTLNAYQTWISWIINSAAAPTVCLINNAGTTSGTAYLDVVSSEGAAIISNANMGTIAARTSNMATFTANSASLAGGTAVDLSALAANARYAPRLTFTANPANVSVQCIQTDPVTGGRRPVNTLQNAGTWTY